MGEPLSVGHLVVWQTYLLIPLPPRRHTAVTQRLGIRQSGADVAADVLSVEIEAGGVAADVVPQPFDYNRLAPVIMGAAMDVETFWQEPIGASFNRVNPDAPHAEDLG